VKSRYLLPPTTGDYTFWIASDDSSELYLSSDSQRSNSTRIASVSGWVDVQNWTQKSTQQSVVITLEAGKAYYIEALHKESGGGDHLAVAWQGPGISQAVIDGQYLYTVGNNAPTVVNPIPDVHINQDAADTVIDLSNVFTDIDPGDALLVDIAGNTNPGLISTTLNGSQLTLSYAVGQSGVADVTIRAVDRLNTMAVDTFHVEVTATATWTNLLSENFDGGWGDWVDGGVDAQVVTSANGAGGTASLNLQDDSGDVSAAWLANALDLTSYSQFKIEFTYMPISFENAENFFLEYSDDGGATWVVLRDFVNGTDFTNGTRENVAVTMDAATSNFTSNVIIKFRADASGNEDDVYIDNVILSGFSIPNNPPVVMDQSASILEGDAVAVTVLNVVAEDPNSGDVLTYAITAGNIGSAFVIDGSGTIATNSILDYESVSQYHLTVTVTDSGGLSDSATITITVNDLVLSDDSDGNTLNDNWEVIQFGLTGSVGAGSDGDQDGLTTYQEMVFGGDPNVNGSSVAPVQNRIIDDAGTAKLEFRFRRPKNYGDLGVFYQLQQSGDMSSGSWVDDVSTSTITDDGANEWVIFKLALPQAGAAGTFYRCRITPSP